jgi:hypothetical protein
VRESDDKTFGFNAQTEEYGDMFAFGVIDPAKVVRTALEDAASVAGLLITTEAMVADKPKDDKAGAGPVAWAAAWAAWATSDRQAQVHGKGRGRLFFCDTRASAARIGNVPMRPILIAESSRSWKGRRAESSAACARVACRRNRA